MPSEFILGGQRSGKSARAELLAARWLEGSPARRAVFMATARAGDDEMRERIERHRRDRAARVPRMRTVEAEVALAPAIREHAREDTLVVVDCLTLWLTNLLMPADGHEVPHETDVRELFDAIAAARGPLVVVSNEIGLGVIPLGGETRAFVDALGRLNQAVAQRCDRVTLMVAGLPVAVKGHP